MTQIPSGMWIELPYEVRQSVERQIALNNDYASRMNQLELTVAALTKVVDVLERRIAQFERVDPVGSYIEREHGFNGR